MEYMMSSVGMSFSLSMATICLKKILFNIKFLYMTSVHLIYFVI